MGTSVIFRGLISSVLSIGLAAAVVSAAPVQGAVDGASFSIVPASTTVEQNQIFTVDIKVDARNQPLDGAQAYLDFDPNYLRVVDANGNETSQIISGELYSSTWPDVLTNTVKNSSGQISYAAGKGMSGSPANTLFTLASVRFKAITQGGSVPTALILNTDVPRATKAVYGLDTVTGSITNATVTISTAASGPSGGGAGGSSGQPGVTNVINSISAEGRFTQAVTARSEDGKARLTIPKDTIGKNKGGTRLFSLQIVEMTGAADPPADSAVIGQVYDVGPDGATFDPPIELTMRYDESALPEGVAEGNLLLATRDGTASQWAELESTVDEDANTVTANVSHFSAFAIMAHTRPASFSISNLVITPSQINVDGSASISALISNSGDLTDIYEVTIKVNGTTVEAKTISLMGGASERVSFSLTPGAAGEYTVDLSGLAGTLKVNEIRETEKPEIPGVPEVPASFSVSALSISPSAVNTGDRVDISVTVTNSGETGGTYEITLKINDAVEEMKVVNLAGGASQKVAFTTARDAAGTYGVDVNGLSGAFTVKAPGTSSFNWLVIGAVLAGVLIILALGIIFIRRRV